MRHALGTMFWEGSPLLVEKCVIPRNWSIKNEWERSFHFLWEQIVSPFPITTLLQRRFGERRRKKKKKEAWVHFTLSSQGHQSHHDLESSLLCITFPELLMQSNTFLWCWQECITCWEFFYLDYWIPGRERKSSHYVILLWPLLCLLVFIVFVSSFVAMLHNNL